MTTNWDLAEVNLDSAAAQWAAANAEVAADAVRATIPVKTSHTQGTIEAEGIGNEIQVTGDRIASYLETGTEAHEIHGHPWLVFEGDDGTVFLNDDRGKFVHHPGTGPDPYIENAIDATEEALGESLLDACAQQWSQ